MRSASRILGVLVSGLLLIVLAPRASDVPGTPGTVVPEPRVIDPFPGPETRGAYLEYWSDHPLAGHCPYAYLLRGNLSFQLPELWGLWISFADARQPPPGVEIEWQGFPWLLPFGPGSSRVSEDTFDGLAIAGAFESSLVYSAYHFQPEGDSAYVSRSLVRANERAWNSFLLDDSWCL